MRERPAPNSARRGTSLGRFTGHIGVGVRETYTDNLFAEQRDRRSDFITRIRPRARLDSRWQRHGLAATVEADAQRHARHPEENVVDYGGRVQGHLDIGARGRVGGDLSFSREHEDRTSPEDPGGESRTPIDRYAASAEARQRFQRLSLAFAGSYERLDFSDVAARQDNAGTINNDDRDRTVAQASGRVSYRLSGTYEPFIQGNYDRVRYDQARDDDGFNRDSQGYEISVGSLYRPNPFTVAELRLGYRQQNLADPQLSDVRGLTGEIRLVSNLTPTTTFTGEAHRMVQQSTLTSASAFFSTRGAARLDHAMWDNFLLGAESSLARNTFTGIGRDDTIIGSGLDLRYDPSAFLRLSLDYDFARRISTTDAGFRRNRVTVGAELRY